MGHQKYYLQQKNKSKLNNAPLQSTYTQQSATPSLLNHLTPDSILMLQQSHGNQFVQRLVSESPQSLRQSSQSLIDRSFIQRVSFDETPWEDATGASVKESGNGGVVFVSFGEDKIVVKGNKDMYGNANETFGARLAQAVGLNAPQTRYVSEEETHQIDSALSQFDVKVPHGKPYLVIENVNGVDLFDAKNGKTELTIEQVESLAKSLGRWLAFDILIAEKDRFGLLQESGTSGSLNSTNFLLDPTSKTPQIIGIDQRIGITNSKTDSVYDDIKNNDYYSFMGYTVGSLAYTYTGKVKGTDPEELGELVMRGAKEQMLTIGQSLDEEGVISIARTLDVEERIIESLLGRLEKFKT